MPITWTAEMDRKLLLAILEVHDLSIDKTKVAKELNTDEQPCTGMAVQKRLQAIRTMIKNGSDPDATPKAKATPRKRAAAALVGDESPTKKGKVRKAKGAKSTAAEDGEDDGEDGEAGAVKQEGGDEDELEF